MPKPGEQDHSVASYLPLPEESVVGIGGVVQSIHSRHHRVDFPNPAEENSPAIQEGSIGQCADGDGSFNENNASDKATYTEQYAAKTRYIPDSAQKNDRSKAKGR